MTAPVAGSSTSREPPAAERHSVPKIRPRQVDSIRIFGMGAFIPILPWVVPVRSAAATLTRLFFSLSRHRNGPYAPSSPLPSGRDLIRAQLVIGKRQLSLSQQ